MISVMDEHKYRPEHSSSHDQDEGMIVNYERQRHSGDVPVFSTEGKNIPIEYQLEEESELLYSRFGSTTQPTNQPTAQIEPDTLSNTANEMGLSYLELGSDFQELSHKLTNISNISSESNSWWQTTMNDLPYLGGLVEPETGRLLLNLGNDKYALLTGDIQSIHDYMLLMREYSPSSAFFINYSLLSGLEPEVVNEAKDIMMGSRDSDLTDFIDAAKRGNVDINNQESEAVPLLNWIALQAGEQSIDIEENESASGEQTIFAAAISGSTMFVHPYSDGLADNLVESIESIYAIANIAPNNQQSELLEMLDLELLDIINDDNRWGITDNDLRRMTEQIEQLQRQLEQTIERLSLEEAEAEEAAQ